MTLEEIEKKIASLKLDISSSNRIVLDHYRALDARLDSKLHAAEKSKWTPVCVALYSVALLWAGMVLEQVRRGLIALGWF